MLEHINITQLVSTIGYIGIFAIIFAETGLFVGFFLPGDSLLFTAGLLASQRLFDIWILVPVAIVCAILGYSLAYWFGDNLGMWLLRRKDSIWFKKEYIYQAQTFYAKHGGKALIIGRLLPIIRTFVPIVAGMVKMSFRRFYLYNIVGGVLWAAGMLLLGYYLGQTVPNASHYILPIVLTIAVVSVIPAIKQFFSAFLKRRKAMH